MSEDRDSLITEHEMEDNDNLIQYIGNAKDSKSDIYSFIRGQQHNLNRF